jgi:hypothetical protein
MTEPNDGCLQKHAGRQKSASGMTVYLQEELGDARLNCIQLKHYFDEARQVIEKSEAKDHIFEVAGHLLQAIPEHLFKLEKSLQAVALAADRIDYEEIKQDLKPEKVEELERALKEVRIRTVQHRSERGIPMTPQVASEELQKIASEIRATGKLPVAAVLSLVGELEAKDRTASDMTGTADLFDEIGKALLTPSSEAPKRLHLAGVLRRALADHLGSGDLLATEEQRSRFEEGKPADPTENMSEEDAAEWKKRHQENKDNFKGAALDPGPMPRMELIKMDTLVAYRRGVSGNWRMSLMMLTEVVQNIGFLLNELGAGMDGMAKATLFNREILKARRGLKPTEMEEMPLIASEDELLSRHEEGKPADPTKDMSPEDAKKWKENTEKHKDKFKSAVEEQRSRFEEGKPADPTENMSEEDAKKWKQKNEEHKDNFKGAVDLDPNMPPRKLVKPVDWKVGAATPLGSAGLEILREVITEAGSLMGIGSELKKRRIKYEFSLGDPPIAPAYYTVNIGGSKYGIVNKRYADKPDLVVGDIAVGKM